MGYVATVAILIVLIVVVVLVVGRRSRSRGRLSSDHPVMVEKPAASEPTPAASDTAPPNHAEQAQRRVPPA